MGCCNERQAVPIAKAKKEKNTKNQRHSKYTFFNLKEMKMSGKMIFVVVAFLQFSKKKKSIEKRKKISWKIAKKNRKNKSM